MTLAATEKSASCNQGARRGDGRRRCRVLGSSHGLDRGTIGHSSVRVAEVASGQSIALFLRACILTRVTCELVKTLRIDETWEDAREVFGEGSSRRTGPMMPSVAMCFARGLTTLGRSQVTAGQLALPFN